MKGKGNRSKRPTFSVSREFYERTRPKVYALGKTMSGLVEELLADLPPAVARPAKITPPAGMGPVRVTMPGVVPGTDVPTKRLTDLMGAGWSDFEISLAFPVPLEMIARVRVWWLQ